MKSTFFSYLLCAFGLLSPLAGLHRFYLNKPISGIFYLITWGFFGIGSIIDLIRMPTLVDEANMREFFYRHVLRPYEKKNRINSREHAILKCAHNNNGVVTATMVALSSGLLINEAREELEKMYKNGFCEKDIDQNGTEIYSFKGLRAERPIIE